MNLSTRLTAAMIALVLGTSAAVGLLGYYNVEAAVVPSALERVTTQARARAAEFDTYLRAVRSDVLAVRTIPAHDGIVRAMLGGGIDAEDGTPTSKWRERLETIYAGQLQAKPAYVRLRFIGLADGGREIVRVERSGAGNPGRVVAHGELQRKGDRGYFKNAIGLPAGEVYVSPIELNQEHGVVEIPHIPVLRFATPVQTPDGKPFGIVVINLDVGPTFAAVRAAMDGDFEDLPCQRAGRLSVAPGCRPRVRLRSRPTLPLAGRVPGIRTKAGFRRGRRSGGEGCER